MPDSAASRVPLQQFAMYNTSAYDSISTCNISTALEINPRSSHFHVEITLKEQNRDIATAAMVDSGATALFMNKEFIRQHGIWTFPLRRPIGIFNIDGTKNQAGQITHFVRAQLSIDGHKQWNDFLDPEVDWEKGRLSIPDPKEEIRATLTPSDESSADETTITASGPVYAHCKRF